MRARHLARNRTQPRRVAVLALMIVAATAWAWWHADEGAADLLRFAAGVGAGAAVAGVIRLADGALSGRLDFATRSDLARVGGTLGAVIGVLAASVLTAPFEHAEVFLGGGFAGLLLGVGVLYPID